MARVLVIDDDEEHRTLVHHILVQAGHQVEEAANGAEGLRAFGRTRPDVVLTDIDMPGLDGRDVISALHAEHAQVPVIAISGGGTVVTDERLLEAASLGAVEVITKPFEYAQLVGAVARALELER